MMNGTKEETEKRVFGRESSFAQDCLINIDSKPEKRNVALIAVIHTTGMISETLCLVHLLKLLFFFVCVF